MKMIEKIYVTAEEIESVLCNRSEQQTAVSWYRDDAKIVLCTSDNTMITKMRRYVEKNPDTYKCFYYETNRDLDTGKLGNYFFEFPANCLSFRSGGAKKRKPRAMSEEQRAAVSERFKAARLKKSSSKECEIDQLENSQENSDENYSAV